MKHGLRHARCVVACGPGIVTIPCFFSITATLGGISGRSRPAGQYPNVGDVCRPSRFHA